MEARMERKIMKLRRLCQLDVDAAGAYSAAIARITAPILREKLTEFRGDHLRHVMALNELLRRLGAEEVRDAPDFKGTVLKGFTALTSMIGNEAALMAMLGNEELTTRTYHSALRLEWNGEERALIERHFADERRHLEWIKQAARHRHWARKEAEAHP
jgi:rubrerythrin